MTYTRPADQIGMVIELLKKFYGSCGQKPERYTLPVSEQESVLLNALGFLSTAMDCPKDNFSRLWTLKSELFEVPVRR